MMPDYHQSLYERSISDAIKQPVKELHMYTPPGQWTEEDHAYFYRQTTDPLQALSAYGGYTVYYMGERDDGHWYQVKQGERVIADVAASQLMQTIVEIVEQRRTAENNERKARGAETLT